MSASTYSNEILPPLAAEEVVKQSRSNFVLSFLSLPPERRRGISHFYAFSRVVDDAVDEHGPEEAERLLALWRKEVQLCYHGEPTHPVSQAMRETVRIFDIPQHYLELLIEGCEMDLHKSRYANFEELHHYCYRVAGVIGLVCMKIFGLGGPAAEAGAVDLGMALQLTNILRDVAVDAEKQRVYLPEDELRRYGVAPEDLLAGKMRAEFIPLFRFQAERADEYYRKAFHEMEKLPRKPLLAAWIMGKTYHRILKKIRARDFDVFYQPVKLSKPLKLWIALRERFR